MGLATKFSTHLSVTRIRAHFGVCVCVCVCVSVCVRECVCVCVWGGGVGGGDNLRLATTRSVCFGYNE